MGRLKYDHIKRLIILTSDNIKRLPLYYKTSFSYRKDNHLGITRGQTFVGVNEIVVAADFSNFFRTIAIKFDLASTSRFALQMPKNRSWLATEKRFFYRKEFWQSFFFTTKLIKAPNDFVSFQICVLCALIMLFLVYILILSYKIPDKLWAKGSPILKFQ